MTKAPRTKGLYHFAYPCRDAEETRHFYEDILGLPLVNCMLPIACPARARKRRMRISSSSWATARTSPSSTWAAMRCPAPSPNTPGLGAALRDGNGFGAGRARHARAPDAFGVAVTRPVDHDSSLDLFLRPERPAARDRSPHGSARIISQQARGGSASSTRRSGRGRKRSSEARSSAAESATSHGASSLQQEPSRGSTQHRVRAHLQQLRLANVVMSRAFDLQ